MDMICCLDMSWCSIAVYAVCGANLYIVLTTEYLSSRIDLENELHLPLVYLYRTITASLQVYLLQ